jgi:multisubunit Na+/H+ antiporter MnhF subunit
MNAFTIAATVLLAGYLPLGFVALRREPIDAVVALQVGGGLGVLIILCFAEGFHRSFEYAVAVIAALMSWIGGLVFVRFLGRWL